MLDMHQLLGRLKPRLDEIASSAGFVPTDAGQASGDDHVDVGRLEYRATSTGQRKYLLDICVIESRRTVTASYWSPDDLVTAKLSEGVEAVAVHYRTWDYDPLADPDALADQVAAEVVGWVG